MALLPLPTGANDLKRLKPLFRYDVYRTSLRPGPGDRRRTCRARSPTTVAANPHWLDEELARIAAELAKTPRWVYASRDKGFDPDAPEPSRRAAPPARARSRRVTARPTPPVISRRERRRKRYGDFVAVARRELRDPARRVLLDARARRAAARPRCCA